MAGDERFVQDPENIDRTAAVPQDGMAVFLREKTESDVDSFNYPESVDKKVQMCYNTSYYDRGIPGKRRTGAQHVLV